MLEARDITIAITVYDRRAYVNHAIRSALAQRGPTRPQVIVVEDCGPDADLRDMVLNEFGSRIAYHRNSRRRGLFDNWNACLELCSTPWLCILHDDDFLKPTFVESMIELSSATPGRALYYGSGEVVDAAGEPIERRSSPEAFSWHELPLEDWICYDPVCFPTQLFHVATARTVGGFRANSRYTADWEMWFKLTLASGSAATNRVVAIYREHHSLGRGTTAVDISGRKYACVNMQRKRHIAMLRPKRPDLRFDRHALFAEGPIPTRFLFEHGHGFSPRMLRYNARLLLASSAPSRRYRLIQLLVRLLSWRSVKLMSWIYSLGRLRATNRCVLL